MNPISPFSSILYFIITITTIWTALIFSAANGCSYTSIFSVGDSIADTGNFLISVGSNSSHIANWPYGETFFHQPTGRFSDGRLIIDFIAEALGKPPIPPFLGGQKYEAGMNFAVGGATAIDAGFFYERGLKPGTNFSLNVQMQWFRQFWASFCASHADCTNHLSKSLFLVGEIGGNDYNGPFLQGTDIKEILTFIPLTINAISSAINELIELGARTLLVPGNFPIGCNPMYLTHFKSSQDKENYYDKRTGCINWLNDFAEYFNSKLVEELETLRLLHPYANIIYADYYNAGMSIYASSNPFGYGAVPLQACCGGGGLYNINLSAPCGTKNANVCSEPWKYANWDGPHFTEAAYHVMANGLLNGSFTVPPFNKICPDTKFGYAVDM